MLQLTRFYKNTDGADLRVDTITLTEKYDNICVGANGGRVWVREVKKMNMYSATDREIATIEVFGDFDSVETSTGSFIWASWNRPSVDLDMSDLPVVGETI
jgi:thiamine pyrophosphokinase